MQSFFKLMIFSAGVLANAKDEVAKQSKNNGIATVSVEQNLFEKIHNVVSEFNKLKLTADQNQEVPGFSV